MLFVPNSSQWGLVLQQLRNFMYYSYNTILSALYEIIKRIQKKYIKSFLRYKIKATMNWYKQFYLTFHSETTFKKTSCIEWEYHMLNEWISLKNPKDLIYINEQVREPSKLSKLILNIIFEVNMKLSSSLNSKQSKYLLDRLKSTTAP
jgi:hypothetical protein